MWKTIFSRWFRVSLLAWAGVGAQIHLAVAGTDDPRITFRHPALAGNFASLNVMLNPALAPGETLDVYSNGHLAARIKGTGLGIERVAFYIALVDDGAIEARILDGSGNTLITRTTTIPSDVPRLKNPPPVEQTMDRPSVNRVMARKNKVMLELQHGLAPGRTGHISLKSETGSLNLKVTPYIWKKAKLIFWLDRDAGKMAVTDTRAE
ncbi:MAG TPA: hypothetical protein ENJ79_10850 [Gammaproteobacteria bacterium]|nr:hypothetical protein [Gammaproteobacteria bacterium]